MADILRRVAPVLEEEFIDILALDFAWNIVLGIMPLEFEGIEDQIMEHNRKDTTAEKIDNIERITSISEYLLESKPDFSYENLELFSQATGQLIKYAAGDREAENSLKPLKDLYISFVTSYYIESVKNGKVLPAIRNIKNINAKIFTGSPEINTKLLEIVS
ncbi:MAG TPA: hypothetical protein PLQ06_03320 [Bacteroidales bacterium]|mgnify:FL=1|nr:hypothetical protein [Bacteroidales bacterium]